MNEMKGRGAFVTGAASEIGKDHATEWFLQYPVMPTLTPAYPRGPWHYTNMHQLAVTYESTAEAGARWSRRLSDLPTAIA